MTPLQWATTGANHFGEIDDDPDSPVTTDFISETADTEVDVIALDDAPGDFDSANTATLKVFGKASNDIGYSCEMRKADETVVATVTFVKGVDTSNVLKSSAAIDISTFTQADVDGLKLRFIATTV